MPPKAGVSAAILRCAPALRPPHRVSATGTPAVGCVVDRLRLPDRHRGRGGRGLETAQGEVTWLTSVPSRSPAGIPGRDRHPERPDQGRPHRPRDQPGQRQRPQPSGLCRPRRDRRRLVEALQRGPRLSLGQAGRSELQRSDLRQPLRRRGRRDLHPDLVPQPQAQRRLSRTCNAPPGPPGGAFASSRSFADRREQKQRHPSPRRRRSEKCNTRAQSHARRIALSDRANKNAPQPRRSIAPFDARA